MSRDNKKAFIDSCNQFLAEEGTNRMGLMSNGTWNIDPKRLAIMLSRYKFVSKMLSGRLSAVEIGCGDAFGSRIVKQEVENLTVVDIEPLFIEDINERQMEGWYLNAVEHDILSGPMEKTFEAAYSLDVLEHIPKDREDLFLQNISESVVERGVIIIGMPSLESQEYASRASKEGHINCKSGTDLKAVCEKHFKNVFLFSMNDEVVHTGFYPMAHYLLAVCVK